MTDAGGAPQRPHPDPRRGDATDGTQTALRSRAEKVSAALPPLLAQAERLAATLLIGEHGRRRAGLGDEFWQYRPAMAGDGMRGIDWRRSARSDQHFVREKEWQAAQSVMFWVDDARAMAFSGAPGRPAKADRAQLLALAAMVLLVRGGERIGLIGQGSPARGGQAQLGRLAMHLAAGGEDGGGRSGTAGLAQAEAAPDYGRPDQQALPAWSRGVFMSDFLGDIEPLESALAKAATQGVRGALVQILDPAEEEFPFDGRTIFESMGGALRFETRKAGDLRGRYLARLAERKDRLAALARAAGWQYQCHHTGSPAQTALLWLYGALERGH